MIGATDWVEVLRLAGVILTAFGVIGGLVAKWRERLKRVEGAVTTAAGTDMDSAGEVLREWLTDLRTRVHELEESERECRKELETLRRKIGTDLDRRGR